MARAFDITGRTFGRLTAIRPAEKTSDNKRETQWECECECGAKVIVRTGCLTGGRTKSCGCLRVDVSGQNGILSWRANFITHGHSRTSEYRSWRMMKTRCYNPNNNRYHRYGGRGIQVCDEWRDSFEAFLAYMGPKPTPQHSIDRYPNYDGNYEPGNVRWATRSEQELNKPRRRKKEIVVDSEAGLTALISEYPAGVEETAVVT